MSGAELALPPALEALLQAVCAEQGVPPRWHDALRGLLLGPREEWPVCCKGSCAPCIDEQTAVAREVLARWAAQRGGRGPEP